MKIIHTSDLHIDSPLTSHLSADKVRERRAELFSTLSAMVEAATACGAGIMIIAGDLFDSERITKTARRRTLSLISTHREIKFFYLPGNHEELGLISGEDALPDNLFVFVKYQLFAEKFGAVFDKNSFRINEFVEFKSILKRFK